MRPSSPEEAHQEKRKIFEVSQVRNTNPFQQLAQGWFDYLPITNWSHFWSRFISPTINLDFGGNIEDAPTEQRVLDSVGSYGKQINRLNDAVSVLTGLLDRSRLNPEQQMLVRKFELMAAEADKAVANAQGGPRHAISNSEVGEMLERIVALRKSEPERYTELVRALSTISLVLGEAHSTQHIRAPEPPTTAI